MNDNRNLTVLPTISNTEMFTLFNLKALVLEMEDAYAHLLGVHQALFEAEEVLAQAKRQLEQEGCTVIVKGVEGSNATEREARMKLALTTQRNDVYAAQALASRKALDVRLATFEWDLLKSQLRAFEVATKLIGTGKEAA